MSDDFNHLVVPPIPDFSHVQRRQEELAGRNDAEGAFKHLQMRISRFQADLGDDEEVGIRLANFGIPAQLHIRSIGYKKSEFDGIFWNT